MKKESQPGSWQAVAKPVAKKLFNELRQEFPAPGMRRMILRALDREQKRSEKGESMAEWRHALKLTPEQAGTRLGLSVEEIAEIEAGMVSCPMDVLRRVRAELKGINGGNIEH